MNYKNARTPNNYKPQKGSIQSTETKTSQSGNIPTHIRVKQYQLAGIRLGQMRKEQYEVYKNDADFDDRIDTTISDLRNLSDIELLQRKKELDKRVRNAMNGTIESVPESEETPDDSTISEGSETEESTPE